MNKTLIKSTAKWTYTPKELFVESFACEYQGYELYFENSIVTATFIQPKESMTFNEFTKIKKIFLIFLKFNL